MIEFPEGRISSIVVSTILGHGGRGMFPLCFSPNYQHILSLVKREEVSIITKSSTGDPHVGNYIAWKPWTWHYVQSLNGGLLNAYGLTNPGSIKCADKICRSVAARYNVIPNIYLQFNKGRDQEIEKAKRTFRYLKSKLGKQFWISELSYSCPNSKEDIRHNMKDALICTRELKKDFPEIRQIAKISIIHPLEFAVNLESEGADVIHGVNTIPFHVLFPGKVSPLAKVGGGGVSGAPAFSEAFAYNRKLRHKVRGPLIMGCGVHDMDSAKKCFISGANSVSICTVVRKNIPAAQDIINYLS